MGIKCKSYNFCLRVSRFIWIFIFILSTVCIMSACTGDNVGSGIATADNDGNSVSSEKTVGTRDKDKYNDTKDNTKDDNTNNNVLDKTEGAYIAVPAKLFYGKQGTLILGKDFKDKKYIPDVEIDGPVMISKKNIYAEDSESLCPGIYSLDKEKWLYKADKMYNLSSLGDGITFVDTNSSVYWYDDQIVNKKIKDKYKDVIPEGDGKDNFILDEQGDIISYLPYGDANRFGDYIWVNVKEGSGYDAVNTQINIYNLEGALINTIFPDKGCEIYTTVIGDYKIDEKYKRYAVVKNINSSNLNVSSAIYDTAGNKLLDIGSLIGTTPDDIVECAMYYQKDICLIQYYKKNQACAVLYDLKSNRVISKSVSESTLANLELNGKAYAVMKSQDDFYNVFEDGVLKRKLTQEEAQLLEEGIFFTAYIKDTDKNILVLHDIILGEDIELEHNGYLKPEDLENRRVDNNTLGKNCRIVSFYKKDMEDVYEGNSTISMLFYNGKCIAAGDNINDSDSGAVSMDVFIDTQKEEGYRSISIYKEFKNTEEKSDETLSNDNEFITKNIFEAILTPEGELIRLDEKDLDEKYVIYYGDDFYICMHGNCIECYNFKHELLRREYSDDEETQADLYD